MGAIILPSSKSSVAARPCEQKSTREVGAIISYNEQTCFQIIMSLNTLLRSQDRVCVGRLPGSSPHSTNLSANPSYFAHLDSRALGTVGLEENILMIRGAKRMNHDQIPCDEMQSHSTRRQAGEEGARVAT